MLLTAFLCLLFSQLQAQEATAKVAQADVLLLVSCEPTDPAAQIIVNTIRDRFARQDEIRVHLHVEFLDSDHFSNAEYLAAFRNLLAYRHDNFGDTYDLVMTAGDSALRLIADQYEFFRRPPVVFLGASNADLIRRVRKDGDFTGLPDVLPVYEFISLMRYLFPGANNIHVIDDGTEGQEQHYRALEVAAESLDVKLVLHDLSQLSWAELTQQLSQIHNQPLLLLSAHQDGQGVQLSLPQAVERISAQSGSPVWSLWQQGVGDGLAGTVFTDVGDAASMAVQLAQEILAGHPARDIPAEWQTHYKTLVDMKVLEKYGLQDVSLPKSVIVINDAPAFYEEYSGAVIFSGLIIFILIAFLLLFYLETRRRRLSDIQLNQRTDLMRNIIDSVPDLMFYKDTQGRYVLSNRRYNEFFGINPIGLNDYEVFDKDTAEYFRQKDREAITRKGGDTNEEWVHGADGSTMLIETKKMPIYSPDGELQGVFGLSRDITALKKAQENLEHIAHHDVLTGLPNRLLLNKRLEYALQLSRRSGESLAVVFIDLDRFKDINDTIGHDIGDLLLKDVAQRLNANVRDSDICARLGGDEFVIVLTQVDTPEKIQEKCEQLLQIISRPYSLQSHMLSVFASAGISIYPEHGNRVDELIRNADAALHKAKELGRNCYCYYHRELTDSIHSRMSLEQDMRSAMESHQFLLHYQPQFHVGENRPRRVEALLRWIHPVRGSISPLDFIPLAETTGMIVELGYWVVRSACQQFMFWREQGLELDKIAVNVSAIQINASFANTIAGIMDHLDFRPEWLELEVTESLMMSGTTEVNQQVHKLREMGVEFAIDDFGTGYSSLSKIKSMPVTVLKIDQSFVRDINDDVNDYEIIRAIVLMAKSLGLTVVAEGVERQEQEETLYRIGCEWMQGYHYARPMDGNSFYQQYASAD